MIKLAMRTSDQVRGVMDHIQARLRLRAMGVYQYRPHMYFEIEHPDFSIRLAQDGADLEQLAKFRFQQFFPQRINDTPWGLDLDRYDRTADHLMIFDKKTKGLVGTYRLLCSEFTNNFYIESEFQVRNFFELPGSKLELGRAAVHPKYRNGAVIHLLWRGIAEYIHLTGVRWLFGCASIPTLDPFEVSAFEKVLRKNHSLRESGFSFNPNEKYCGPTIKDHWTNIPVDEMKRQLPPLFRSYLSAGVVIAGSPAFDFDFQCVDFPIVLDLKDLNPAFQRRYMNRNKGGA